MVSRKLSVVVIDDDPAIVRILRNILENSFSNEIELTDFVDPIEAQNWIDSNCCDILVSDIDMPEVNGMEMLIFAKRRNAWTQVIFLTGQASWMYVTDAVENGASDFLLKPINMHELRTVVQQHIDRARRWQAALFPKRAAT